MTTFELFIDDDRYAPPQLVFIDAEHGAAAAKAAEAMLRQNEHYRGVELRRGDELLFAAGSFEKLVQP